MFRLIFMSCKTLINNLIFLAMERGFFLQGNIQNMGVAELMYDVTLEADKYY
jgi:hypothetical protein